MYRIRIAVHIKGYRALNAHCEQFSTEYSGLLF